MNHSENGLANGTLNAWGKVHNNGHAQKMTTPSTRTAAVDPFRPFPTELLPSAVAEYVTSAAKAIGCDVGFVAAPMLALLAASIGATTRIQVKPGWTEPAIAWCAVVAESGGHKSPALDAATVFLRRWQHTKMREFQQAVKDHELALARYEKELSAWKRDPDAGDPPVKPEAPTAARVWADDITVEGLGRLLLENPRGVCVVKDELAGWFAFDQYRAKGGSDAPKWLSLFGGRPMTIDRKGAPPIYIPHASASLVGTVQPGVLSKLLTDEHRLSGLAARMLFVAPPRSAKRWTDATVDHLTEAAVARIFDRLLGLRFATDDQGEDRPRILTFAPDAQREFERFYNEHGELQDGMTGDTLSVAAKMEAYAARFALVLSLTEWATDRTAGMPGPVDAVAVCRAIELSRWFMVEIDRVHNLLVESPDARRLRELCEWVARRGGLATSRDVAKGMRIYRGNQTGADRDMHRLADQGIGTYGFDAPSATGGRPSKLFRLRVSATETPSHDPARRGFGDADTEATPTQTPPDSPEPGYWSDGSPIIPPPDFGEPDGGEPC